MFGMFLLLRAINYNLLKCAEDFDIMSKINYNKCERLKVRN